MNSIFKLNAYWKSISKADFLFWAVIIAALLPWAYFRSQQATHSDILWLCEVLRRYFNGIPLSIGGYENNPPLSMLIYSIPVLAEKWLGAPLHYTVFIQTTLFIAISSLAVYKIMAAWQVLEKHVVQILTVGYILAMSVGTSLYLGERDHLVALALTPFVLAQITLTFNLRRPRGWMKPVFAIGAVLILLKPHHGLIPTLLLIHRAIKQHRLSVVFDADFVCLALAVLGYASLLFTVFADYTFIILPDAVKLYLPIGSFKFTSSALHWVTALCFALLLTATLLKMKREEILSASFLTICAALSLIPYAVQKMGFYYHLLPVLAFLFMTISLVVYGILRTEIKSDTLIGILVIVLMTIMTYIFAPLNIHYPNHKSFAQTPLANLVTNCPDLNDCKFYMVNREMGVMHETAYYTGTTIASRFASPWYLKTIFDTIKNRAEGIEGPLSNEEFHYYLTRFAEMTSEDLNSFKPQYLIIWDWRVWGIEDSFIALLSGNENFVESMRAYQKKGPFHINYIDYYTGLEKAKDEVLDYTVYERKPGK